MVSGSKGLRALTGLAGGAIAGGLAGLVIGLAYVEFAHVSDFEGLSGYAVAFWIMAGVIAGAFTGLAIGMRKG